MWVSNEKKNKKKKPQPNKFSPSKGKTKVRRSYDQYSRKSNTVIRFPTSIYDLVEVRCYLQDHFYILSRYLISQILMFTQVPYHKSLRIAMDLKKKLVDEEKVNIDQEQMLKHLFEIMKKSGYGGKYTRRYEMIIRMYNQRVPVIILISGTGLIGKSTIAVRLSERLNLANILQTEIVYGLMVDHIQKFKPNQRIWYRDFGGDMETFFKEFKYECKIVQQGVSPDISKSLRDGKSIIIEGSHVALANFTELITNHNMAVVERKNNIKEQAKKKLGIKTSLIERLRLERKKNIKKNSQVQETQKEKEKEKEGKKKENEKEKEKEKIENQEIIKKEKEKENKQEPEKQKKNKKTENKEIIDNEKEKEKEKENEPEQDKEKENSSNLETSDESDDELEKEGERHSKKKYQILKKTFLERQQLPKDSKGVIIPILLTLHEDYHRSYVEDWVSCLENYDILKGCGDDLETQTNNLLKRYQIVQQILIDSCPSETEIVVIEPGEIESILNTLQSAILERIEIAANLGEF
ncbi:p-loop containing nucleoside triphosphate hydrolases superfamily protein [Anaeramoeba flamelloides]|uniref:P-loop containing nucleoside triphosphate hydrolases superfamily protein n=1 Tax=Anaeramoeba flamelloides TaxID=1746091 RepID=A0AAV8A1W5_9EUKA|nr:p-loop containing nucleoside triphosphate hydrolases superfamily protein [Anaeramoeba flamelloides]